MTRALILAAGQGVRLRPLTDDKPKCMVPFQGRPLIEYQLETLKHAGIDDICVVTGYRSHQVEALGVATIKNARYATSNMVSSLFSALPFIEQQPAEDLIIAYGDIIYQKKNLALMLDNHDELGLMIDANWRALWAARLDDPLEDAETLLMNEQGYIVELGKKPSDYSQIQGQYTGLIKVRADKLVDFVSFYQALDRHKIYDGRDFDNMYMTAFLQALIDSGWGVKAVIVQGGWLELDSVEDLNKYESLAKQGQLNQFYDASL